MDAAGNVREIHERVAEGHGVPLRHEIRPGRLPTDSTELSFRGAAPGDESHAWLKNVSPLEREEWPGRVGLCLLAGNQPKPLLPGTGILFGTAPEGLLLLDESTSRARFEKRC